MSLVGSPSAVNSPYGPAMLFGSGDAANVDGWGGILGALPRTFIVLARWDMAATITVNNGTLLGYGHPTTAGQRWNFRVNEDGVNGTQGAIRVEVAAGFNIASTDVRDGAYHVMAHSFSGSHVTDVKFYLDGNPDASSGSSSWPVNTTASTTDFRWCYNLVSSTDRNWTGDFVLGIALGVSLSAEEHRRIANDIFGLIRRADEPPFFAAAVAGSTIPVFDHHYRSMRAA